MYRALWTATVEAERDPVRATRSTKTIKPVTDRLFDPLKGQYLAYLVSLTQERTAFRGDPPQARVNVQSVDMTHTPYPRVVLRNCPTVSTTWQKYIVKTGKSVPETKSGDVPPPHELTITMILVDGRWGASAVSANGNQTCTAQ